MNNVLKTSTGYMTVAGLLGILLGLIMLLYPGGTLILMESAFWLFQLFLSIFILYYALSEAAHYFKVGRAGSGIGYIVIGILATLFVWLFNVGVIYFIVSFFLILAGIGEIIASFRTVGGEAMFFLLGLVNIFFGFLILTNIFVLPIIIAWYVIFWGISRFLFSLQLRRTLLP